MWNTIYSILFCITITYCTPADIKIFADQSIKIYSTSRPNPGFNLTIANFSSVKDPAAVVLKVNDTIKYQKIVGFGGTFTDSTGVNLNKLSSDVRTKVYEALFSDNGIGVNLCRVPIGCTEFSPRHYTLNDQTNDVNLTGFALQTEDLVDKIPIIKEAKSLTKGELKLFASAWTAPIWMKDHKIWSGFSLLSDKYGLVYAEYLKKFLDAYEEKGIQFWGITTGALPSYGFQTSKPNSMGWLPDLQAQWIKENFGPVIRNSSHKDIKIIGHDDTAATFSYFAPTYAEDDQTVNYLDGLATHWYATDVHLTVEDFAKNNMKELFLLATDAKYGKVTTILDNWDKATKVLVNLFKRLQNHVGWVDYSLVLNAEGGPSYAGSQCDAPIILSADLKSFTKTPMYYVLGHFSKFVIPGSIRIDLKLIPVRSSVYALAFLRPDGIKVISIYNGNAATIKFQISLHNDYSNVIEISGGSINSLLFTK